MKSSQMETIFEIRQRLKFLRSRKKEWTFLPTAYSGLCRRIYQLQKQLRKIK